MGALVRVIIFKQVLLLYLFRCALKIFNWQKYVDTWEGFLEHFEYLAAKLCSCAARTALGR